MPAEPTGDAELVRLLDENGQAEYELGTHPSERRYTRQQDTRDALLAHIAAHYVRRDRLVADEWDDLDATAELEGAPE
jgi:hypothetical protein